MTYNCAWNPAFGKTLANTLKKFDKHSQLDLGCVASKGTFETSYDSEKFEMSSSLSKIALAAFIFRLLARFQTLATVPAIDYKEYNKWLS